MVYAKLLIVTMVVAIHLQEIYGHGMMMDPVSRSSAWRKGFRTPPNYNDNELFCGGAGIHHGVNKGKCGVCGDNYALPRPRPNENGGVFGTGTIVRTYNRGQYINVDVKLTANHRGTFTFNLCPLRHSKELETEECFNRYPLKLQDGSTTYKVGAGRDFKVSLVLPASVNCEHCVLRWEYRAGNNWGICPDGTGRVGCGAQETFRNCADIRIH